MLNGIHLVDYGNHRDTRITFGRMTALVGQNGAGKTNMMRGIMELKRAFRSMSHETDSSEDKVRSGMTKWQISASWAGTLSSDEVGLQDGSWAVNIGSKMRHNWLWHADTEGGEIWVPHPLDNLEDIPAWDGRSPSLRRTYNSVTGKVPPGTTVRTLGGMDDTWLSRYFKTAGSYLQGPSYSERSVPILSKDCRDLAWVLAYLKGDKDKVFADVMEALREVVPTFLRVRNRPVAVQRLEKKSIVINEVSRLYDEEQKVMGQELRFDMASGSDLPASAISEGTLVTLAILTAVMHDDSSAEEGTKTILLDDVESGLHPSAQRDLIRQLRRLQEVRPELQIIFSSHSPYIIDEMQPEDVWLFAPDKEGIAHCAKLSDHPDAKRALEVLTTGEFWSAEGESWVLDRAKQTNEVATATK